jgi:hypothetical protein
MSSDPGRSPSDDRPFRFSTLSSIDAINELDAEEAGVGSRYGFLLGIGHRLGVPSWDGRRNCDPGVDRRDGQRTTRT